MSRLRAITGICAVVLGLLWSISVPLSAQTLITARLVFTDAHYNDFTDLTRFKGQFYLTFRSGDAHGITPGSTVRVLQSGDGQNWHQVAQFSAPDGGDLRDPKLNVTPTGQLVVTAGDAGTPGNFQNLRWSSSDGMTWGSGQAFGSSSLWIWRTEWNNGVAYGAGYGGYWDNVTVAALLSSTNGVNFTPLANPLVIANSPSEIALTFQSNGTAVALIRLDGAPNSLIGTATGDYTNWTFHSTGQQIGGPDMITLSTGQIVAASRLFDENGVRYTGLSWVDPVVGTLTPFMRLPSNADTGYAGLVLVDDVLWVSYYSNGGEIWLAQVDFAPTPAVTTPPTNTAASTGTNATFSVVAGGSGPFTYQWSKNGTPIAGATSASLMLANVQPLSAGLFRAAISNSVRTTNSDAAILGVSSSVKVVGGGSEVLADLVHQNGNVYDQILLGVTDGASGSTAATVTADPGQVVRTSFLDNTDDIVQVEFSGAGALTIVIDGATGPSAPTKYNQSVAYMKGHPAIVITGANETTNVSVFSVGTITAVNQALFKNVPYDGVADIAYIAIASTNGKFGGVRAANASFFATKGFTGIYAPGVTFTGPVYVGNVNAFDQATPVLTLGSATDVRVTGGDLLQTNGSPVQAAGFTSLRFVDGSTSHGQLLGAKTNGASFQRNGIDVTNQIQIGR